MTQPYPIVTLIMNFPLAAVVAKPTFFIIFTHLVIYLGIWWLNQKSISYNETAQRKIHKSGKHLMGIVSWPCTRSQNSTILYIYHVTSTNVQKPLLFKYIMPPTYIQSAILLGYQSESSDDSQ